jgi:hypothetical protein
MCEACFGKNIKPIKNGGVKRDPYLNKGGGVLYAISAAFTPMCCSIFSTVPLRGMTQKNQHIVRY